MKDLDIRLSLEEKDNFYLITANVAQFTGGIFVGSGATLSEAFEDIKRRLIQNIEDRGISPKRHIRVEIEQIGMAINANSNRRWKESLENLIRQLTEALEERQMLPT